MKVYKFQSDWLQREDAMNYKIGRWWENFQEMQNHAYCHVCQKSFSYSAKGFADIFQHSSSVKHAKNIANKVDVNQLKFQAMEYQKSNVSQKPVKLWSSHNQSSTAEILWSIRCIHCNMSGNSCDGLANTFKAMFPDSQIVNDFTLSSTKFRYLVTEALEPYYKTKLIDDVNQSSGFVISYDETTNAEGRKELQTRVRYFSEKSNEIIDHHLKKYFLGTATADILVEHLNDAMKDFAINKLIMLGSDGPNVNKSVYDKMNKQMLSSRKKGLLNVGTCNLHVFNNALVKGISEFGKDVSDFAIDVYYFFHKEPTRIEDYETIQKKHNLEPRRFIKHSSTRWLTIKESAILLCKQWPALNEYFLKFLLNKKGMKNTLESLRYKSISNHLRQKDMLAQIHFVISSSTLFNTFSKLFQKEEPLVHLMFDKMENLILTLAGRICSPESVKQFKRNKLTCEDLFAENNFVDLKSIPLDQDVRSQMKDFSEKDSLIFLTNVRNHYKKAALHILEKSSLRAYPQSSILYACRCLQPRRICSKYSVLDIVKIAENLPLENLSTTGLIDEWQLLQLEPLSDLQVDERFDHFYQKNIFQKKNSSGDLMFPLITKVVKVALSLSHGNADVERGFSTSKLTLTKDKTRMDERTLNARLTVYDSTKKFKDQLHLLPITQDLLTKAQFAHRSYKDYLENEEKRKNEMSEASKREELRIEEEKKNLNRIKQINSNLQELKIQLKSLQKQKSEKEKKVLNNLLQSRLSKVQINCNKEILSTNSQLASKSQSKIKKSVIKNATNVRESSESETLSSKPKARKRKTDNKKTVVPEKKQKVIQNKRIDSFLKTNQENKGIVFIPHDSELRDGKGKRKVDFRLYNRL